MSSRQFRRRDKQNNFPPPPPDDSDDDYQPLYTKKSGFSNYAGLEVSSPSQSEHASEPSEEDSKENAAPTKSTGAKKKTFKKKGKEERKGKAGEKKGKGGQVAAEGLDEVERSVKEVNDLLGSPPAPQPAPPKPVNQALDVLTVDPKHLNVANEIRKLFGSEEAQPKRGRTQNRALLLRRVLIHPDSKTPVYDFNNSGLSMMKYKDKENRMYFLFNHSEAYQKMHRNFLRKFVVARGSGEIVRYFDEARQKMHVEALLEISDRLFRMEENGVANEIVENVVTFLQYVADPLFILSKNNVRLDYKFMENRPFFVAMLKYVYLLTNRACHRTALEIAKMLLLLDPTDPLALLSIIDILALRAREHEWLIETVKYFDRQREAGLLFNIKFSNSLAHFHVANKNHLPLDEADELIRDAILAFPNVFIKILECCHVSKPELLKHEIFKPDDPTDWLSGASEPFLIYATMSFPRWNEPDVMSWLLRNATELCKSYDTDLDIQDSAKCWSISRSSLYRVWPKEYMRHISILTPMSKLIIDTSLSSHRVSCAWDPLFHKSVNRYSYSYKYEPPRAAPPAGAAAAAAASPVHSQMRSDYHRMTTQAAPPPGCYPLMSAPFMGSPSTEYHSYPYRDVVFMPPQTDVTAVRRMYPNATLIPLCEPPRFSPGFVVPFADWNAMPTGPMFPNWGIDGLPNPNNGVKNQQPTSRDWAFDDLDPAFDNYDYADDVKNFSRDDCDMARALATEGPGETATGGKPKNEKKD